MAEGVRAAPPPARGEETVWPTPWVPVEGDRDGVQAHLEYWALRAVLGVVARLPGFAARGLAAGMTRACHALDRRRTESARAFLRQAYGDLPEDELERRVRAAWSYLWDLTLETVTFDRHYTGDPADHFAHEIAPRARAVMEGGGGAVLVTPHLGSWEFAALGLQTLGMRAVYAISKPPRNRPLSRYAQRLRDRRGLRLIPRKGAVRIAVEALRHHAALCIMIDQKPRRRWVEAPFFGRPARCDRSAAVLLKRLDVPVVVGACLRAEEPYRYVLRVPTVLEPEEVREASLEEVMTRINAEMEQLILGAPEQYLWLHERY